MMLKKKLCRDFWKNYNKISLCFNSISTNILQYPYIIYLKFSMITLFMFPIHICFLQIFLLFSIWALSFTHWQAFLKQKTPVVLFIFKSGGTQTSCLTNSRPVLLAGSDINYMVIFPTMWSDWTCHCEKANSVSLGPFLGRSGIQRIFFNSLSWKVMS